MKIALAQLNYHIGHFEQNIQKIKKAIRGAKDKGADLVVFAELAVSGYPPRDFLEFGDFVERCRQSIHELAQEADDIGVIVGSPSLNNKQRGKPLYNSAYFLYDGQVQKIVNKTLLPNYNIFDEYRYFEPNREFITVQLQGKIIALTICEDLWDETPAGPNSSQAMYSRTPMDMLISDSPDMIINISASPFDYNHSDARYEVLKRNSEQYNLPIFYVNHIGAQTELIFDGGSMVFDAEGELSGMLPYFEEALQVFDLEEITHSRKAPGQEPTKRMHAPQIPLSTVQALGPDNVRVLMMPSEFSSEHFVTDSDLLVQNLGCQQDTIAIHDIYHSFLNTLHPFIQDTAFDVTEENIQSRIRGTLLMAFSNKFGNILLNTSNKSEAAVGYGTLYGDMAGGLSILGDVYKTQVYELARYINRNCEVIPQNIIDKPPSAELRPDQKDSDSLPAYRILDDLLYQYIEMRKGPDDLKETGFDASLVDRVLKMVNSSEHKRYQTPPILRVSTKAFGMGRRMPIVARYLT
ncbi:MAG: NAD(+) synthase [Bacteroidetes bacterium SW_11_45_7]|nr:MAG: NAD(+) synthase [Bacteroidetes bacterium SW_11_45_7]